MVPLLLMPASADSPQAFFDRVAAAIESTLGFPTLLMAPDLSDANAVEAWPRVFAELKGKYKVTERGLVMGCGAGARHAQYLALDHPADVIACAALSADAWASTEDCLNPVAIRPVRWLIGSSADASRGSLEQAACFQVELAEAGCAVDFLDWDGKVNHLPDHAIENTLRFFNDLAGEARVAA
ncbi:MAG: hypothetical protein AAF086_09535 [Planctomycetota bacterium]